MRIQNLKAPHDTAVPSPSPAGPATAGRERLLVAHDAAAAPVSAESAGPAMERQAAEIALLKARVQHLELVVETARALMGANQERLLRRLHELPRELIELTAQLRRIDPNAAC